MGYNPYKWYSKGKLHTKLKKSAPLLLKIRNGDFDISSYFREAINEKLNYKKIFNKEFDSINGDSINSKKFLAHQKARMRNIAYLKLMEDGMKDEERILFNFRDELKQEFGIDLWEIVTSVELGLNSLEDIYWKYKELSQTGITPSEIAIQLGRDTTNGLK